MYVYLIQAKYGTLKGDKENVFLTAESGTNNTFSGNWLHRGVNKVSGNVVAVASRLSESRIILG